MTPNERIDIRRANALLMFGSRRARHGKKEIGSMYRLQNVGTWRIRVLHYVGKALGVLLHIDGLPYGSSRNILTKS